MPPTPPGFVHLHCHTDGSLLDGANKVSRLIARAKALSMPALAVTDHGVMYSAFEFYEQAKAAGITPILGMEAYVAPAARQDRATKTIGGKPYFHLVLLAQNLTGYKNLCKLSSRGFTEGFYYHPRLDREILKEHSDGLIVSSACLAGEIAQHLEAEDFEGAKRAAAWYAEVFQGRYYLEVQGHDAPGQAALNAQILQMGDQLGIPVIATNDTHFLNADDHAAHDTLVCVGMRKSREDPDRLIYDQGLYFKSAEEMAARFPDRPDVLTRTVDIAAQVDVCFEKKYYVPSFPIPAADRAALQATVDAQGGTEAVLPAKTVADPSLSATEKVQRALENQLLRDLAFAGAAERYPMPLTEEIRTRLDYELGVITTAGYAGYHLIVQDFIAAAKAKGIPVGPGRGSAAGSAVCYALGITDVDPLPYGLLFERFLNPERVSMPDIDVDFCFERRGEVIDYVREKYGRDAVCQIVTFGTLKARAAVKDVGRVLNFTPQETDALAKLIPNAPNYNLTVAEAIEKVPEVAERYADPRYRELLDFAARLEGLRRHASVHAAGVVIAPGPVTDYVPVSVQRDGTGSGGSDMLVTQYDMNCLEHAGMLKMDFLGLKTLTVIADAMAAIQAGRGETVDWARIPLTDETTFQMIQKGRTAGVFQMESNLATEKLMAMRASTFDDIVAASALLRPGPLDTGMTDKYIRRKRGEEPVEYPHPLLEDALKDTQGIIVYQEQVMRAAQDLGGYSLAQADVLRKAVGKKDAALIQKELGSFVLAAVAKGTCTKEQAETIARLIETFGRYGFNKSHSVAYGILTYRTAYLKAQYPAEFMAALLSSEIGDTDKVSQYLAECRELGLAVLPPDVNESAAKFTVVRDAAGTPRLRFALVAIRDVGAGVVEALLAEKAHGPYASFFEFVTRLSASDKLNRKALDALISVGACDGLGATRGQMLAVADAALRDAGHTRKAVAQGQMSLFGGLPASAGASLALPTVPDLPPMERLAREKQGLGLYVSGHPLDAYGEVAHSLATFTAAKARDQFLEGPQRVVGVVTLVEEKVSKKSGKRYAKILVDDGTGPVACVVFPDTWERFALMATEGSLVVVHGSFDERDREADKRDFRADRIQGLPDALAAGDVAVTIQMDDQLAGDSPSMARVKAILAAHAGNAPVYLRYEKGSERVEKRAHAKVATSKDLLQALRAVVGPTRIGVTPPNPEDATSPPDQGGRRFRSRR